MGFHDQAKVRKCKVEKNNPIVNALNRTKEVRARARTRLRVCDVYKQTHTHTP